jgi:hypothetical protein
MGSRLKPGAFKLYGSTGFNLHCPPPYSPSLFFTTIYRRSSRLRTESMRL